MQYPSNQKTKNKQNVSKTNGWLFALKMAALIVAIELMESPVLRAG